MAQGELIVAYAPGASRSDRIAVRRGNGARFGRRMLLPRTEVVKVDPRESEEVAAERFERDPRVLYAEPNAIRTLAAIPDDTLFGSMWGLHNTGQPVNGVSGTADADIDAPEAWDVTLGSDQVVVAVVDTGLAAGHPDIQPNLWVNPGETAGNGLDDDNSGLIDDVSGWDFADGDANPLDTDGHGTHVAGTAAARGGNALGVTGVSQRSRIMPLKVFPDGGAGATNADIANAFVYAGAKGAKVANASLGGPGFSQAMSEAIAGAPGTLFVVAAGNDAQNNDAAGDYPCNFTHANLICVAATDQSDAFASFTNYGATSVDLAAPGVRTRSTYPAFEPVFTEDFTANDFATKWTVTGSWARTDEKTETGTGHSLTDSPGASYADNRSSANNYAQLANPIDLTGRQGCVLEFQSSINVEVGRDFLRLEASANGATWALVDSYSYADGSNWFPTSGSLAGFSGAPVHIRFVLQSDASNSMMNDGAHIDDVDVSCLGADFTTAYAYLSGTSMASPHVAGAAALVFSANPGAPVSFVRSALLSTVDPLPSGTDRARLVTGGRLNADRAVRYVTPQSPTSAPDSQTQAPAQAPAPSETQTALAPPPPAPAAPTGSGGTDAPSARELADLALGFPRGLFTVRGLGGLRGLSAWSSTRSARVRASHRTVDPRLALVNTGGGSARVVLRATFTPGDRLARSSGSVRLPAERMSIPPGSARRVRLRLSRSALKSLTRVRRGTLVLDVGVVDATGRRSRARKPYALSAPRR